VPFDLCRKPTISRSDWHVLTSERMLGEWGSRRGADMTDRSRESGPEHSPLDKSRDETAAMATVSSSLRPWERIKSHKVVQWTVAYAAAAYVFLHGIEMVSGALSWPHLIFRIVTLLLLLGVPLTVTLAWFHGHRGRQRIGGSELAILAVLLVLAAAVLWFLGRPIRAADSIEFAAAEHRAAPIAAAIPTDASIAVLPFVNMSSDPEQEYFSDGMAEQVLNLLSKIPELRVIARTSSFSFKENRDVDVANIAQRLNVAHVLEGSVRKSANRIRVTVQLIKAANSSQLWSDTYDRELTDIFAVQDEIALAVVHQLKLALQGDELPARSTATNMEAYNLFLRGEYLRGQHTEESLNRAVEYYDKALAFDPGYGEAWAALAYLQALLASEGFSDFSVGFEHARVAARKALELNPNLARAHLALGSVQQGYDWDWIAADASFDKAIALDPGDAEVLALAGFYAQTLGNLDVGMELCGQAVARDPVAALPRSLLALSYMYAGQLEEAEEEIRATLEISPDFSFGRYLLGVILLLKGQSAAALDVALKQSNDLWGLALLPLAYYAAGQEGASDAALQNLIELNVGRSAYQIAEAYAFRGEKDMAFTWLDRAYLQRDPGVTNLIVDPLIENLRDDPRYAAMLRKLKLSEPKLRGS
jgi:TolB-like protein